jgi:DNA-binding MarR family transcriptional regulator
VNAKRLSVSDQVAASMHEFEESFDPATLALTLTLYRTVAVFDRAHAVELGPHQLNVSQFNVLNVLRRAAEPMTMGDLGQAVAVRPTNLTAVVDSLCERGLVDRQLNPGDRRSFLVVLTSAGAEFLDGFLPGHWAFLEGLMSGLSHAERKKLVRLLDAFATSIEINTSR